MKEYIKKFESAASADNYEITDIPFTTTIATEPAQNLVCNVEGKKLVNNGGDISVADAGPKLISFTINGRTFQAESEMIWGEWIDSEYNNGGYKEDSGEGLFVTDDVGHILYDSSLNEVMLSYDIIPNENYTHDVGTGG